MKSKSFTLSLLIISLFIFFFVDLTKDVADKLSGEFFPRNSPIWAGLYPNDFLPWGAIFFLLFGSILVNFLLFKINEKYILRFIIFLSFIVPLIEILQGSRHSEEWVFFLTKLFNVWWFALIMGLALPLLLLNLMKQTKEDEKQNE